MVSTSSNSATNAANGSSRGWKRMRELRVEREAERVKVEAELLADLGHVASASERLLIEQLAVMTVNRRRLSAAGRHADAEMCSRLIMRGMTKLGIRQGQAKPAGPSPHEYFAQRYGKPPAALDEEPGTEAPSDEPRISEALTDHRGGAE